MNLQTAKQLITAPAVEPVSLAEAKAHLRVISDADDLYITGLIQTAREAAEGYTERAFISQDWELSLDRFPIGDIEVPLPPLSAVASIQYFDSDNTLQTLSTDDY